jgi:hypothetical protein
MYIMEPEPISTVYFSLCVCKCIPLSLLGKNRYRGKVFTSNKRRIVGRVVSQCGPCHIKGKYAIGSSQNFLCFKNKESRLKMNASVVCKMAAYAL